MSEPGEEAKALDMALAVIQPVLDAYNKDIAVEFPGDESVLAPRGVLDVRLAQAIQRALDEAAERERIGSASRALKAWFTNDQTRHDMGAIICKAIAGIAFERVTFNANTPDAPIESIAARKRGETHEA